MSHDPAASEPAAQQPQPEQPQKDNTLKIVLIVVGAILLLGVLACAGLIGLGIWGFRGAMSQIQEQMAEEFAPQLRENPEVVAELGEVESIRFNFSATTEANQDVETGDDVIMVFDAVGTEGTGEIHATMEQGTNRLKSAVLILPDGERVPLDVSDIEAPGAEEPEIEMGEPAEPGAEEPAAEEPVETEAGEPVGTEAGEPVGAAP